MFDISRIWMNHQALWMGQFLQAAKMPLWTALPICHVRTLGFLCWQSHGHRRDPCKAQRPEVYPDCSGHILSGASVLGGWRQMHIKHSTQWGVGKLLTPLDIFLKFVEKTLNSGFVPKGFCGYSPDFFRLTLIPPQEFVVAFPRITEWMDFGIMLCSYLGSRNYSLWIVWPLSDYLIFLIL